MTKRLQKNLISLLDKVAVLCIFTLFILFSSFQVYTQNGFSLSSLQNEAFNGEVIINKSIQIPVTSLIRYIVIDPSIVSVVKSSENLLTITGNKYGQTIIHIWDSLGLQSKRIIVIPESKIYKKQHVVDLMEKKKKEQTRKKDVVPIRYKYDYDGYYLGMKDSNLAERRRSDGHQFFSKKKTKYGTFDSHVYIEKVHDREKLWDDRNLTFKLLNGNIFGIRGFDFIALDHYINLDRYVLPGTRLRGAVLQSAGTIGRYDDFFIHNKPEFVAFWGREQLGGRLGVRAGQAEKFDSFITGIKVLTPVRKDVNVFTTLVKRYGDYKHNRVDHVGSLGLKYNRSFLSLFTEGSRDGSNYAYMIKPRLSFKRMKDTVEYFQVDPRFNNPIGRPVNCGVHGLKNTFTLLLTDYLTFGHDMYFYKSKVNFNDEDPKYINKDIRYKVGVKLPYKVSLRSQYLTRDNKGRRIPTLLKTFDVFLNKTFLMPVHHFIKTIVFRTSFYRRKRRNIEDSLQDYISSKLETRFNMRLRNGLSSGVRIQQYWIKEIKNNKEFSPFSWMLDCSYTKSFRLLHYPASVNVWGSYEQQQDADSQFSSLRGVKEVELGSKINLDISPTKRMYIKSQYRTTEFVKKERESVVDLQVYAGGDILFDVPVGFINMSRVKVQGYVFFDLNSNGKMDENETGVENVSIFFDNVHEKQTDKRGAFYIKTKQNGEVQIRVVTKTIPKGYTFTTPSLQTIETTGKKEIFVYFGINAYASVVGRVYNDVNLNMKYDAGDRGVAFVSIETSLQTFAHTNVTGQYSLGKVAVNTSYVKISDIAGVEGYSSLVPIFQPVQLTAGKTKIIDFPLKASRSVTGKVFYDINKNGWFDEGDIPIKNCKINIGHIVKKTNNQGDYIVSDLSPGNYLIELDETFFKDAILENTKKEITLGDDPIIVRGTNFAIKQNEEIKKKKRFFTQ